MIKNFLNLFKNKDEKIVQGRLSLAHQKIHMDEDAKARTRALLQEYMEMRPIRTTAHAHKAAHPSLFNTIILVSRQGYIVPITAVVLIFGLTAGTAFAAEGALPGDTLYPIKVHVTEEVRSVLATTPKAQADWGIERTSRRLEEASTLAVLGRLTSANRAEIEANLALHVTTAEKKAKILADNNDYTDAGMVGAELYAVLKAHGDILASVLPAVDEESGPSDGHSLISDIATHLDFAAAMSARGDTTATTTEAAASKRKDIASNEISSLRSYIEQKKSDGGAPELTVRASVQLQKAEAAYADAVKDLEKGATSSALRKFSTARNTALDTKASLSAQTRLLNVSLQLAQTQTTDERSDEAIPAKEVAPLIKTAATKSQLARTSSATSTSKDSKRDGEKPASRTDVLDSVIGVLLHGSESTSRQENQDQGTSSSVETKSSSEKTGANHDSEDSFDHDLKSVPLGL